MMKFLPSGLPAEKQFTAAELEVQASKADIAVLTLGRISGEFFDRKSAHAEAQPLFYRG